MDIKDEIIETILEVAEYRFDVKEDDKYCYFRVNIQAADDLHDHLNHLQSLLKKLTKSKNKQRA